MTHVLILGADGQLGSALQSVYANRPDTRVTIGDLPDFDITKAETAAQVAELAPDIVINAAAWTNVDAAEENPELVFAVNSLGPHNLAAGCARCDALLVQISTNEVFPGVPDRFYFEYDQPGPSGIYARSKLAGETAVRSTWCRSMVVRVAWMFGPGGNNFPSKILAAAEKYGQLRVVDDEFGNPTYAPDAADGIAKLIDHDRPGIYHLVNEGYTSRFDFAAEVLRQNGREAPMTPVHADEWQRASTPPPHAVVVNQAAAALGIRQRPWQEALADYVHAQEALNIGSA
jgi:dTDP-4-dehydrorhamnose reductase